MTVDVVCDPNNYAFTLTIGAGTTQVKEVSSGNEFFLIDSYSMTPTTCTPTGMVYSAVAAGVTSTEIDSASSLTPTSGTSFDIFALTRTAIATINFDFRLQFDVGQVRDFGPYVL